jgi:hypothetical protein
MGTSPAARRYGKATPTAVCATHPDEGRPRDNPWRSALTPVPDRAHRPFHHHPAATSAPRAAPVRTVCRSRGFGKRQDRASQTNNRRFVLIENAVATRCLTIIKDLATRRPFGPANGVAMSGEVKAFSRVMNDLHA